jgi:hypothetical protein
MSSKCDFRFDPWWRLGDPEWTLKGFRDLLDFVDPRRATATQFAASLPDAKVRIDSEGGAWRVSTSSERFNGAIGSTPQGWVAVGRDPDFNGEVGSAKCDWQVRTPAAELAGQRAEWVRELQARFAGGRLSAESAKCDWRVNTFGEDVVTTTIVDRQRMRFEATASNFSGQVSAAGNEWKLATSAGDLRSRRAPEIDAELSSSKCDFAMRVRVGLPDGPAFQVRAVGSDKCDFRFERLEYADDGVDFRTLPTRALKGRG